jgi:uncharacterized protein
MKTLYVKNSWQVKEGVITKLLSLSRCHTWYVQYACNKLYETGIGINYENYKDVKQEILSAMEPFYLEYRNLLTRHQWQLLKAIARSDGSNMLTSGSFIKKYNLYNASTIKRSVDSLLDKEMIFKKNENYFVYDVFLSRWLEMQDI